MLFAPLRVDQVDHADCAPEGEGAVGEDRRPHVEGEPHRLEGGHERPDGLALQRSIPHHQNRQRQHERPDRLEAVDRIEDQEAQHDPPGEGEGELVLVAERQPARPDRPGDHRGRMGKKPKGGREDGAFFHPLRQLGDPDEEEEGGSDIEDEGDHECRVFNRLIHMCYPFSPRRL